MLRSDAGRNKEDDATLVYDYDFQRFATSLRKMCLQRRERSVWFTDFDALREEENCMNVHQFANNYNGGEYGFGFFRCEYFCFPGLHALPGAQKTYLMQSSIKLCCSNYCAIDLV